MFNPVHSIANQELFEKHKVASMKTTDYFHYEGKSSRATTKSTPFDVNKDEWDRNEDTAKSMKYALYVLRYAKRNVSG